MSKNEYGVESQKKPTRRQALRATVAGAATMAGLSATASASNTCGITESDRQAVRDQYNDQATLTAAFEQQDDLQQTLLEENLVAGEEHKVQIYAHVYNCELVPEYLIFREAADGSRLTVALRPDTNVSHAIVDPDPFDPDFSCEPMNTRYDCEDSCPVGCVCTGPGLLCGCEGAQVPCDPWCCYKCYCSDDDDDGGVDGDPGVVATEDGWFEAAF